MRTRILNIVPGVRSMGDEIRRLSSENEQLQHQREALAAERDELKDHCSRLDGELAAALERELRARDDANELHEHAHRLELERRDAEQRSDELCRQIDKVSVERDELKSHALRLTAAQAEWEAERATLTQERDELKRHLERIDREYVQRCWTPPGHFYSPVVDPRDVRVGSEIESCAGIAVDADRMLDLFERIGRVYSEVRFPEHRSSDSRYFFDNPAFGYGDAITLFGFLREFNPNKLIEIGCGYSSCLIMDTNDRYLDGRIDASFYDPYPDTVLSLLRENDPYRERIHRVALQDIPTSSFQALEANDILFIDSSHVAKSGSDVIDYLFRVMPGLRAGVLVHIHDVIYPFEYPREWVVDQNRSWNEAYFVRAFLMYNRDFEVVYLNDFVYNRFRDLTQERMPLCLRNTGGSLWLRKVR